MEKACKASLVRKIKEQDRAARSTGEKEKGKRTHLATLWREALSRHAFLWTLSDVHSEHKR